MKILLAEEQTENIHKVKTSDVPTHAYDPYLMMLQCFSDGELYVGPIKNVGDVESFDMLIVPFPETNISHLANSKVLKVFLQMEPCITKYIEGVDSLNEMLINLSTYDVRIAYNLYEKRFICSFLDCFHVKPPCIPNDFSTSDEVEWDVCVGTRVGIGGVRYHGWQIIELLKMFVDCGYKVNAGTWNDSTDKLRSLFPTITFHEKRVSGFEFIEFMKRSRVVVTHKIVPSFNQSAHQAMWCRIPSVGTVSGYQIDLYPNLTVDVGCVMKQFVKIQKVITDDRFANKHTEIALIRAEEFSVENAVQEFTRIIHCLGGRHA